jgi:hypothetical protein
MIKVPFDSVTRRLFLCSPLFLKNLKTGARPAQRENPFFSCGVCALRERKREKGFVVRISFSYSGASEAAKDEKAGGKENGSLLWVRWEMMRASNARSHYFAK